MDADLTQDQVASALDWSLSKIVRIENGAVRVSTTDLKAMLDQYKITDPGRVADLVAMGKVARQRPWWSSYREIVSPRYLEFVELEQAAAATLHFQPLFAPGILQTREYANAVTWQLAREMSQERADSLLEFRMRRQKLLDAPEPPALSFVLDESVVHRRVGTAEVMSAQIRRLIELAKRSHITIQVFPFAAGIAYGMQAPFVIHQFPDPADPDVLYLEGPRGDTLVANDAEEIERYHRAFEELQRMSMSGPESVKFLQDLSGSR